MNSFSKQFIDISHLIAEEFNRNVGIYGEKIKCRRGCSKCCYQIFRITHADAEMIRAHVNLLPIPAKNFLKQKAKDCLSLRKECTDTIEFSENPGTIPCPALGQDGECTIYEARPVICRRFGPPLYDYKNPGKLFACKLNFTEGEEIIDKDLVAKQTIIGRKWDELKTEFNIAHGLNENASTTIAEAILS